ncbi:hypothetical protein SAMN02982985_01639 [Rugamonas rubra]|uniref:Uncharacterized protein n=2 Tax=Rugamonas rubra TaxID=758825 RepID=A0A1I4KUN4_9BURK|nr:hypothetical protein SAMN02982985_01639 [Rugamonas rubra]
MILDTEQYRYQKFISDIAGQDIRAHENSESKVIACVRNWLMTESKRKDIPGGGHIFVRYERFKADLPAICKKTRIELTELTYPDYVTFAAEWVKVEPLEEGGHADQDLS